MALVFRYKLVSHLPGSTTTAGNALSGPASFSPDGRYVLFESLASNLAGSDSNGGSDLFLYDSLDFSVDLVSHIPASTTTAANSATDAGGAFFSPDDRYLLFQSGASNLAGGDLNGGTDVFLYDTQNSSVTLLSRVSGNQSVTADGESISLAFSPDGHNLLFASRATNLLSASTNPNRDFNLYLFSIDTQFPFTAGQTTLVSHTGSSTTTSASNSSPVSVASFSPDGRYVLFDSLANNLVIGQADTNGVTDLFLYDTQNNTSALVSHMSGSTSTTANNSSPVSAASFSPDGRYVLFDSRATNLGAVADTNGAPDLFLYDTQDGSIDLVSHIPGSTTTAGSGATFGAGTIFSPNGRYVLFKSDASNLVANDGNGTTDLFLYDTQNSSITLVSHIPGSTTTTANGGSGVSTLAFSPDSRYVLFDGLASNLAGTDANASFDLFLYDTQDSSVDLVSHAAGSATTTGNAGSSTVAQPFSQDSRYVLFNSFASNLVATDTNGADDAFLYDTLDGSVRLVSAAAGGAANGTSIATSFGPDGRSVVLRSDATNLGGITLADLNNAFDVFLVTFANVNPVDDFNGDGKSGVLWRHDSGQVYFWEMDGLGIKAEGGVAHAPVPTDWHIQGAGDFDGDGKSDVLWRHDSGQVYFWEMDGLGIKAEGAAAHAAVPNDWHIQGVGDFDGDAKSDILWRHDSGQVYIWEMDGLGTKGEGSVVHAAVPNDWHIQGVGDFDGDAKSDILWRHDSGQVYIWEMDGVGTKAEGGVVHAAVPNDWHIQGVGDFDGDGMSDILWRHDSGQVYIWEMNGLGIKAEGGVAHAPVPNDWHVQDIGDFNGDGKSDILWRHDSGQVYTWEMNGLGIAAEGSVPHAPVPSDWHVFSPYNFV
jgi:Tol biopolymer transport system component